MMFSPYQASGFYRAPVTKSLLGSLVLSSVTFNIPLSTHRHWFHFTYESLFEKRDLFRYLLSRIVFLDPKDILCSGILLYHFRIFERRYGSAKFANYILATFLVSLLLEVILWFVCHEIGIRIEDVPSGPWGLIFALFVQFFNDIPRVAITHLMSIPVTGKSLMYIIGLQMCSTSFESAILALAGVISGLMYRNNLLYIREWMRFPSILATLCDKTLGAMLKTPAPSNLNQTIGATLEIQRQQHMEQLEQQMMWAQVQERPAAGNGLGFGLFGNNQNNGNNANNAYVPYNNQQANPPPEEQVQQLVDMGFPRDSVINAMRMSNNDINVATNFLLHQ